MPRIGAMYAGSSGFSHGQNKMYWGMGNGKWQGLPATRNMRTGPLLTHVRSQAYSTPEQRSKVFLFRPIKPQSPPIGGNISNYTDSNGVTYVVHAFTSDGTFTILGSSLPVDVLIVGGGGGGGSAVALTPDDGDSNAAAGGGGGGGQVIGESIVLTRGDSNVVIGAGGGGGTSIPVYDGNGKADNAWANAFETLSNETTPEKNVTDGDDGSDSRFISTIGTYVASGGKGGKSGIGGTPSIQLDNANMEFLPREFTAYGKGGASGGEQFSGGNGSDTYTDIGGGGGGGGSGGNGSSGVEESVIDHSVVTGGNGGTAITSGINGTLIKYGLGGGGGSTAFVVASTETSIPGNNNITNKPGLGGSSQEAHILTPGATAADSVNNKPNPGQANTGGGGGGASSNPYSINDNDDNSAIQSPEKGPMNGANGAAGTIIIRYKVSDLRSYI